MKSQSSPDSLIRSNAKQLNALKCIHFTARDKDMQILPFAIRMFNVKPQDIHRNVIFIKASIHSGKTDNSIHIVQYTHTDACLLVDEHSRIQGNVTTLTFTSSLNKTTN